MPYVQVPKDLTKVKTKVALNLTKRQLISFGAAAAVSLPVFLLTKPHIGTSNAMILLVATAFPFFFFAMYEKNEQPIEVILKNVINWNKRPKKRLYRTENLYSAMGTRKGEMPGGKVKKPGKGHGKKAAAAGGGKKRKANGKKGRKR